MLCGVCGVKEVCKEESDELEGHGDKSVPDKGEETANNEAVDEDVVAVEGSRGQNRSFPVWWC